MRASLAAAILIAASGCLAPGGPHAPGNDVVQPLAILNDRPIISTGPDHVLWQGGRLVAPDATEEQQLSGFLSPVPRPACTPTRCESVPFTLPDGTNGSVVVSIEWEGQDEVYNSVGNYMGGPRLKMDMWVTREGALAAEGRESGHYAGVAILSDALPGNYSVEVAAAWGTGTYYGSIARLIPPPPTPDAPEVGLMPDLIMLPPDHLTLDLPIANQAAPALELVDEGCGPDELAEDQDLRCLRYAGIIGNQGDGPFELVLSYNEAAASATGSGHWDQVIYDRSGAAKRTPAGAASYHAVHGHFHLQALVETTLHQVDDAGERGPSLGDGRKTGFCLIDGGLVDQRRPFAVEPVYFGGGCCYLAVFCQLDMATYDEFYMGIGAGWYDIYPWYRADQYVEVTGLANGLYDLVTVVNPDGVFLESNPDNNEAWTRFRLTGNIVEMLNMTTLATVGPHPDAKWGGEPA